VHFIAPKSLQSLALPSLLVCLCCAGGSLKLRPLEGYGTDTYVHLHRLRTNSRELIPEALGDTFERYIHTHTHIDIQIQVQAD
jgi:hypothetical protein